MSCPKKIFSPCIACGTPVIASAHTAIPEVAGDAASYVEPNNVDELVLKLEQLLNDEIKQQSMKELGFQRARQFTWNRAAQETLSVYREVTASLV